MDTVKTREWKSLALSSVAPQPLFYPPPCSPASPTASAAVTSCFPGASSLLSQLLSLFVRLYSFYGSSPLSTPSCVFFSFFVFFFFSFLVSAPHVLSTPFKVHKQPQFGHLISTPSNYYLSCNNLGLYELFLPHTASGNRCISFSV